MVIRSENKFAEGLLQTVLTAKWVASIEPDRQTGPIGVSEYGGAGASDSEMSLCARARRSELLRIVRLRDMDAADTAGDIDRPALVMSEGG